MKKVDDFYYQTYENPCINELETESAIKYLFEQLAELKAEIAKLKQSQEASDDNQ